MIMNKTELLLSEGWKFHFGECEEAWYQGYDDRAFERVMLPHDWAVAYPFSKQYSSGTGYLTGGIGWYRLHFYLPEEYQGKAIRLEFDGVYKNSQVWVNSYYQGKHPYLRDRSSLLCIEHTFFSCTVLHDISHGIELFRDHLPVFQKTVVPRMI